MNVRRNGRVAGVSVGVTLQAKEHVVGINGPLGFDRDHESPCSNSMRHIVTFNQLPI